MSRNEHRRVVRTLRSGTVTSRSVKAMSIGTENVHTTLERHLREFITDAAAGRFVLVKGDWGTGKSHIAVLCEDIIHDCALPLVRHAVDGRSGSLAHAHRCIPQWLNQCRFGTVTGFPAAFNSRWLDATEARVWCRSNWSPFAQGLRLALDGDSSGWVLALGHLLQ